jgi:hypothetical protein
MMNKNPLLSEILRLRYLLFDITETEEKPNKRRAVNGKKENSKQPASY